MVFFLVVLLSFVPAFIYAVIVYWLDRFEKEPYRLLFGAFFWGALIATIGAIVWTTLFQMSIMALTGDEAMADFTGTTVLAPLVEESLKGLAVLIILLAFPYEFDSILDGMVYAAITALGFAATENVLYLYFEGYATDGTEGLIILFILRVILGGWGHAVYTAFIGIGLAVARLRPGWPIKIIAPFLGWCAAVFLHGLHNTMATILGGNLGLGGLGATLVVDWLGWAAVLGIVVWALLRERNWMRAYLRDEVTQGTITEEQYQIASSIRKQFGARTRGKVARRFYTICAELAQKKHQLAQLGNERDNSARIAQLRGELAQLAQQI